MNSWTRRDAMARLLVGLAAGALTTSGALAQAVAPPSELATELPGARLSGGGRLTFFGLQVYDARLWVTSDFKAASFERAPMALELVYARKLVGSLIADRSLEEMRGQSEPAPEKAARWLASMKQIFPDVASGDRLTGVHVPDSAARFFLNGKFVGEIRDAEFARLFFGIWLSPRTSEPKLRNALLAGG
jgi:hypothetical protein